MVAAALMGFDGCPVSPIHQPTGVRRMRPDVGGGVENGEMESSCLQGQGT